MIDESSRIKAELNDARGLCDALGLLDGRPGRDWLRQTAGVMIRCLWHDEKSPSCSVTTARGTVRVRCFGCQMTGDALTLIAEVARLDVRADFLDVLDIAADLAGVSRPERRRASECPRFERRVIQHEQPAPPPAPDGVIARIAAVLDDVAPVQRSDAGMAYLRSRGLDESVAATWYAVPEEPVRSRIVREIVEEIGLDAWMASGLASVEGPRAGMWSYAWSGARLVIPWRDPAGEVETLQGRVIGPCAEGVRKYTFPRERRPRWPWGCEGLSDACGPDTSVALVEGVIDAVSLGLLARRANADLVALAIPGTGAWRDEWLGLVARRPVVVALDGDAAGAQAGADLAKTLRAVARRGEHGPMVTIRKPTRGKDWNEQWTAA